MSEREQNIPGSILGCVERLIAEYLLRRKETVIQATIELFAGLVIGLSLEALVGISDIPKYHQYFEKYYKDKPIPSSGIWNDEWKFWLHGIGCELTHRKTGEKFDWDLGDPNFFTQSEFLAHLMWRIHNNPNRDISTYMVWAKTNDFDEMYGEMERVFNALQRKNILEHINYDWEYIEWGRAEWMFVNPIFDYAKTYTMPRF